MTIRYPAVAGSFYPKDAEELRLEVLQMLGEAPQKTVHPKALIAPHAGYIYSGPIAATAYNTLSPYADQIERVVLLGPSHRVPLLGIATPGCDTFRTPLGDIPIDLKATDKISTLSGVHAMPNAHSAEHSLEVHLPFLQIILGDFKLVPLVVGESTPEEVADVIETLWGGDETLIIVSSDLSHYHPYHEAQILDSDTTHAIERFSTQIQGEQACGCRPLNGLLHAAKHHHLTLTTLDVRNSGDTAGSPDQVVGYGAYALH